MTFAGLWWPCGGCHTCWRGSRWKSQHRKIVPLSPYVEKLLNSKVIKKVSYLNKEVVFFMFRDSYVLCIYVMNILCTFHISVSGYRTNRASFQQQNTHSHHHLLYLFASHALNYFKSVPPNFGLDKKHKMLGNSSKSVQSRGILLILCYHPWLAADEGRVSQVFSHIV